MKNRTDPTSSRTSRIARNLAALAAGILVSFLVGEVIIRLLPHRWVPELSPVQARPIYLGGMARESDNPRLFYELAPESRAGINSAGYRGPEYPEEKPAGVKRIVGVGNSTLFGVGVDEEDGYLRRVETLLSKNGAAPVQVINLAVPGYNTPQELEMLRVRGFTFDPDLVILGYDHNDPAPILGRRRPPMPEDYGRNVLRSELVRYLLRKSYSRPQIHLRRRVDGHVTGGPGWDSHFEALAELSRVCSERNVPVLVVVYDAMIHREDKEKSRHYRLLHKPFESFRKDHGFYVVDCYDLFQGYMEMHDVENVQALWLSVEPRDAHPTPEGHQLIAEAAVAVIQQNGLLHQRQGL